MHCSRQGGHHLGRRLLPSDVRWRIITPSSTASIMPHRLEFLEGYPAKPPKVKFPPNFFHPNIYPSGTVCLSILNEDEGWKPSITVKQILLGVQVRPLPGMHSIRSHPCTQELLNTPNEDSPAQSDPYVMFTQQPAEYKRKVREQVLRYPPPS